MSLSPHQTYINDEVPYRYGLEKIPADITKQELLAYFSFNAEEQNLIEQNSRLLPYRIVLGIQLGAYKFIGRPQAIPESTPESVIRFVAKELKYQDEFIPLEYSDRTPTRWSHDQVARDYLKLVYFLPKQHQTLINYLMQAAPEPGNLADWTKSAEDYLREKKYVLPSMNKGC